jgi:hypothetical protein
MSPETFNTRNQRYFKKNFGILEINLLPNKNQSHIKI